MEDETPPLWDHLVFRAVAAYEGSANGRRTQKLLDDVEVLLSTLGEFVGLCLEESDGDNDGGAPVSLGASVRAALGLRKTDDHTRDQWRLRNKEEVPEKFRKLFCQRGIDWPSDGEERDDDQDVTVINLGGVRAKKNGQPPAPPASTAGTVAADGETRLDFEICGRRFLCKSPGCRVKSGFPSLPALKKHFDEAHQTDVGGRRKRRKREEEQELLEDDLAEDVNSSWLSDDDLEIPKEKTSARMKLAVVDDDGPAWTEEMTRAVEEKRRKKIEARQPSKKPDKQTISNLKAKVVMANWAEADQRKDQEIKTAIREKREKEKKSVEAVKKSVIASLGSASGRFAMDSWSLQARVLEAAARAEREANPIKKSGVTCYVCKFSCHNYVLLEKHCRSEHPGIPPFKCRKCEFVADDRHKHRLHQRYNHKPAFKCDICDQRFDSQELLNSHAQTHANENAVVCHLCGKGFSCGKYLRKHLRWGHPDRNAHTCEECGRSFMQKSSYETHKLFKHGHNSKTECSAVAAVKPNHSSTDDCRQQQEEVLRQSAEARQAAEILVRQQMSAGHFPLPFGYQNA